ncbi:hypothetical protein C4579_02285 [Candidatus Microgenomates bacterium]|nr:MAG: hypothetical protein C4579_02285 [Candidatus Microgenomates bacterium]
MFKTHLPQNKETLVLLGVISAVIILGMINGLILIPKFIELYRVEVTPSTTLPIDAATVNQAIELLE